MPCNNRTSQLLNATTILSHELQTKDALVKSGIESEGVSVGEIYISCKLYDAFRYLHTIINVLL